MLKQNEYGQPCASVFGPVRPVIFIDTGCGSDAALFCVEGDGSGRRTTDEALKAGMELLNRNLLPYYLSGHYSATLIEPVSGRAYKFKEY